MESTFDSKEDIPLDYSLTHGTKAAQRQSTLTNQDSDLERDHGDEESQQDGGRKRHNNEDEGEENDIEREAAVHDAGNDNGLRN